MTETQRIAEAVWERHANPCVRVGAPYKPIILHIFSVDTGSAATEDYPRTMDLNPGPNTSETPWESLGAFRGLVNTVIIEAAVVVLLVIGWLVFR